MSEELMKKILDLNEAPTFAESLKGISIELKNEELPLEYVIQLS